MRFGPNSTHTENIPLRSKIKVVAYLAVYSIALFVLILSYVSVFNIPDWILTLSFFLLFIIGMILIPTAFWAFRPSRCKYCNTIVMDEKICDECNMGKRSYFLNSSNTFTCKLCDKITPNYKSFLTHFKTEHNDGVGFVAEMIEGIVHIPEESAIENNQSRQKKIDDKISSIKKITETIIP